MPAPSARERVAELLDIVRLGDFGRQAPARALRRHAPAGRAGPHAGPGHAGAADGRAVRRARRDDPRPPARRARADLDRAPADRALRHPQRPRGGPARPTGSCCSPAGPAGSSTRPGSTSPGPGASTPPRSPPSPPTSPTGCARRWAAMASDTLTAAATDADDLRAGRAGARRPGARRPRRRRIWAATWPKLPRWPSSSALWQVVVWTGWKPPYVAARPGRRSARSSADCRPSAELWDGLATTAPARRRRLRRSPSRSGLVLGLAVARIRVLRAAIGSMITALQTMPSIAWFPLAILLFELSEQAIFFVVVLGAAPSIANGVIPASTTCRRCCCGPAATSARGASTCTGTSSRRPRCRPSSPGSSRAGRSPGAA